jgi:hypothetical protein
LAGWGALSDGSTDENDEFPNTRPLEIPEMTHIASVS